MQKLHKLFSGSVSINQEVEEENKSEDSKSDSLLDAIEEKK